VDSPSSFAVFEQSEVQVAAGFPGTGQKGNPESQWLFGSYTRDVDVDEVGSSTRLRGRKALRAQELDEVIHTKGAMFLAEVHVLADRGKQSHASGQHGMGLPVEALHVGATLGAAGRAHARRGAARQDETEEQKTKRPKAHVGNCT
jgi:hypothetical protein